MKIGDIKKLAKINSKHGLCVSLFLNIDKTHQDNHDIKSNLNHLFNGEEKNLTEGHDAKKHLRADYKKIWDFIDKQLNTKNKRGLVIFSNSEMNIFKYFYLKEPIENRVSYSKKFLIRPLIRYLDDNACVLAVFVDQTRGRLVEIDEGKIIKFIDFEDEVPKKVKAGTHYGLADKRIERHVDWHIRGHIKKVADMTLDLLSQDGYCWLFAYGKDKELKMFEDLLHFYPKERLVFDEHVDLLEHGKEHYMKTIAETLEKVKSEKQRNLNDELFEDFPHHGTFGIEKVDEELERGSVQKLILSNRFSMVYPACGNCNYQLHEKSICPNCNVDINAIDWQSNELVVKALSQDSEVHFIDSESLDEKGGIGAILRYQPIKEVS